MLRLSSLKADNITTDTAVQNMQPGDNLNGIEGTNYNIW